MSKAKIIRNGVLTVLFVFTACGGRSADGAARGDSDGSISAGSIAIPIVADPVFNPWHPNAFAESNVVNRVLFSGLTKPGLELAPAPDLAASWKVSDDGLAWTFFLREDVTWHDGEAFTADDVVYTFNEIALNTELGANNMSYFSSLERVDAVDEYTVVFTLTKPVAALPAYLSFNTEILPKHIFQGQDPWDLISFNKEKPIGTGAFRMDSYTSGQSVRLIANPDYYDGAPKLERVEYKVLADVNTHVAQLLTGELSIFALDDQAALSRLEAARDIEIVPAYTPRFFWIALNQENDLFTDVKVRRGMLHAIDRPYIIETVLNGYGTPADAGISPAMQYYYNSDVPRYEYDPERAARLFAEAGWEDSDGDGVLDKNGTPFSFLFEVGIQGNLVRIGQIVQQQLREAGIDARFETLEWNTMIQKNVIRRDYDMILNWWRYPADPDLLPYFHSSTAGTGYNIPGYRDSRLDELLEAGSTIAAPEERRGIYLELQNYMAETLPYLFLWYPMETAVRRANLEGVPESLGFGDSLHYIDEWWISGDG